MASLPITSHWLARIAGALGVAVAALAPLPLHAQDATGATAPQTFKDWQFRCETPEGADEERCAIFQNIVVRESKQQLLNFAVTIPQKDRPAAAVLLLPLGISLPMGVGLAIDDEEQARLAVEHCVQIGCRAVFPVQEDLLTKMKAGKAANVTFHDGARRPITIPVSLSGFTAAYDTLKAH